MSPQRISIPFIDTTGSFYRKLIGKETPEALLRPRELNLKSVSLISIYFYASFVLDIFFFIAVSTIY